MRQLSLMEGARMTLEGAIDLSVASLREYGARYRHWAVSYSGGKDSSVVVTFVVWAIRQGLVDAPESLVVLYADTRMEIPPLQQTAMTLLAEMRRDGIETRVVLPPVERRFFVYMLGRGVPPPSNTFRWCTEMIKIRPMLETLRERYEVTSEKLLMITGVRLGESAVRDRQIVASCSRDWGECGQGWFQAAAGDAIADTLAPLVHWRVCLVWDWLYFWDHGYPVVTDIATVYGEDDVRTGCVGCNLASRDVALGHVVRGAKWAHLAPLMELKPLYRELKRPRWRKRKAEPEALKGGGYGKNVQRMGPLTMAGRAFGLGRVLDIQERAGVDLINAEEEAAIRAMWAMDVWPRKWSANDVNADVLLPVALFVRGGRVVTQARLL